MKFTSEALTPAYALRTHQINSSECCQLSFVLLLWSLQSHHDRHIEVSPINNYSSLIHLGLRYGLKLQVQHWARVAWSVPYQEQHQLCVNGPVLHLRTRMWPGGTLCTLGSGSNTSAVAALKSVDSRCTCKERAHSSAPNYFS